VAEDRNIGTLKTLLANSKLRMRAMAILGFGGVFLSSKMQKLIPGGINMYKVYNFHTMV
jgi:hypothetical protein